jgi:UDP-N-acetylmuramoylalanine--D-glutamate ligase
VTAVEETVAREAASVVRGAAWLTSLRGQRVVVVGLARSGVAAARLLRGAGAHVTGVDAQPFAALGAEARALDALGVRLLTGVPTPIETSHADLVVVSPGVPLDAPVVSDARRRGIPVIGELELGWRALEVDTVAITGTNGKTTTTALTGALLGGGSRPVLVAGNIGTPLSAHAVGFPANGLVVCEVSSFQLETIDRFHPRVAAVLNVTPDHLDRHGSFEVYLEAKARIFLNQSPADTAVLNADDPATRGLAARTRATVVWFSRLGRLENGLFVADGWIVARLDGREEPVSPLSEITLRGQHNVENVLAAAACALALGVTAKTIRRAIGNFRAVAHRIEFVRALDGVHYYNDSKGTNVASTVKAIESFSEPMVLIAGGKGKGQDFGALAVTARGRVRHAVLIGEDASRIEAALATERVPVTRAESMATALDAARALAQPGEIVLLSPACASFDMFDNYEHRGDVFKDLVRGLR